MIYLENSGSLHYSISIIIDFSYLCLNTFSSFHTIQTKLSWIWNIDAINILSIDIIVPISSNPIIIWNDFPSTQFQGKTNIFKYII